MAEGEEWQRGRRGRGGGVAEGERTHLLEGVRHQIQPDADRGPPASREHEHTCQDLLHLMS